MYSWIFTECSLTVDHTAAATNSAGIRNNLAANTRAGVSSSRGESARAERSGLRFSCSRCEPPRERKTSPSGASHTADSELSFVTQHSSQFSAFFKVMMLHSRMLVFSLLTIKSSREPSSDGVRVWGLDCFEGTCLTHILLRVWTRTDRNVHHTFV